MYNCSIESYSMSWTTYNNYLFVINFYNNNIILFYIKKHVFWQQNIVKTMQFIEFKEKLKDFAILNVILKNSIYSQHVKS